MPVRRITRRQIQRAPLRLRRYKRYQPVLVNEFGRVFAEGKPTITKRAARLAGNALLYASGVVSPSASNPSGNIGGGDGGGRFNPDFPI